MRRLIALVLSVLFWASTLPAQYVATVPATTAVTWTLVQHPHNFSCSATGTGATQTLACTVTVTSTTAGDLLILASAVTGPFTVAPTFSAASGDGTWTHCPAQLASVDYSAVNFEATDCAYRLNATGGATSVSFTWTSTAGTGNTWFSDVEFLQVHRSTGAGTFDACTSGTGCIATVTGTATRLGPSGCQTSGTSDYVVQWIAESETIVSISGAAYTNPFDLENSAVEGGFAGALNQASTSAQTWTTSGDGTNDGAAMSCVAFK